MIMIKKMEISCSCGKKYKNRACFEKHQYKCQNEDFEPTTAELLKMIRSLTARVAQLEKQLDTPTEIPEKNFQEELKEMIIIIPTICWEEKIGTIILTIIKDILSNMKSVRSNKVYEDGWVKMRDISCVCFETLVRNIQTKLLAKLSENMDGNYFKNISKLTSVDPKKWVKENISKI